MSASSCLVKHGLETNVVWRQVLEEQDCQSGAAPFDFKGAGFEFLTVKTRDPLKCCLSENMAARFPPELTVMRSN